MKLKILFLFLGTIAFLPLLAQVTIGSGIPPEKAAIMDIKELVPDTLGGITASSGGLLFPRVALSNTDELQPFFPTDSIGNTYYETIQKKAHKGLFVYNLTIDRNAGLETGLYYWTGSKWVLMQKAPEESIYEIENPAEDISVYGEYLNNVPLNTSNYIKIKVKVTKAGAYTIVCKTDPDNGYFFSTDGFFYSPGTYEVVIPGMGSPINFTPKLSQGDLVNVFINNSSDESASIRVKVNDSSAKPNYIMVCNSVTVNGIYKKDIALTTNNTITLKINVSTGSVGATYRITTDMIEGMTFYGEGILGSPGPMEVTLYGTGTPITTSDKLFTISTNSALSPNATCQALIVPVISKKKIMAAGDITYGLTSGDEFGCKAMIDNVMNYGDNPNSIVKYEGFSSVETSASLAGIPTWTGANGGEPYDIILITYNLTPTATQRQQLVDYVNKGGVLIYLDQNVTAANVQMVGAIFGEDIQTPVSILNYCNQVIKMNAGVDDEISNGPFGDVRNGQWGEDFANSCGLPIVPRGAIVYSAATNASTGLSPTTAQATMLRHPTKNFFWCGDSGLIHGGTATSNTTTPFQVGSRTFNGINYPKYPVDKPAYGSAALANRVPVCNSTIFANVMAWAVKAAEDNGINSGN